MIDPMKNNRYSGIIPPLVTPINNEGEVYEPDVRRLIDHVRPFSSALIPALTSGEGWKLSFKQWRDMVTYSLHHAGGIDVLAGVEYSTTREVIERGLLAKQLGAQGVVVTTPFGQCVDQVDILEHFQQINQSLAFPIMVYNEKEISGNHIEYETMLRICEMEWVVGVKEASGDPGYTEKLKGAVDVPIFQGWENLAFSTPTSDGYIFPLCNIDPKVCWEMFQNPSAALQARIDSLCEHYNIMDSAPFANIKKVLKSKGIISLDRVV